MLTTFLMIGYYQAEDYTPTGTETFPYTATTILFTENRF